MRRGFTLIELMVALALLGLSGAVLADELAQARTQVARVLLRERALQALEYRADALTRGRAPDPEVERALLEVLPGGELSRRELGPGVAELTVRWRGAGKPEARSLRVVGVAP